MRMSPSAAAATKQVRRDLAELGWGGDPDRLQRQREEIEQRIEENAKVIAEEKAAITALYSRQYRRYYSVEPLPDAKPTAALDSAQFTIAAAIIVAVLDVTAAAVIGAATFNLSPEYAAAVGATIALGSTVVFKGVCGHVAASFEEERPARKLAVLNRVLLAVAILWAVSFFVLLFLGRFASGGDPVDVVFNVVITAFAVLSPLFSALLLICADVRRWGRALVRLHQRLELAERDIEKLRYRCGIRRGGGPPAPGALPPGRTKVLGRGAAALLLVILGSPGDASAQPVGQLWLDQSPSPDVAALAQALNSSLAVLPRVAEITNVREVEFYGFAGDAFDATPAGSPMLFPAFSQPDCSAKRTSERDRLFKTHGGDRGCTLETDQAREVHDRAAFGETERARAELAQHVPAIPNRTCLVDLLARFSMAGRRPVLFGLIISDGIEACGASGMAQISAPLNGAGIVLVLVPTKKRDLAVSPLRRFLEIKSVWQRRAPWLKSIVPPSGLSADLFGDAVPAPQK
jgi:hypothetical protein